jgi:hypothetical protein
MGNFRGGGGGGQPGCPPGGGGASPGGGGLAERFRQAQQQQQRGPRGPVNPGPRLQPAVPGGGGINTQGRGGFMDGMQPNRPQLQGRMAQQQQIAQQMRAPPNPGGSRMGMGNPRQQRAMRGGPTSYGGGGRLR